MAIRPENRDQFAAPKQHCPDEEHWWAQLVSRYEKIRRIGSGTFGHVFLVRSSISQKLYVVKEIKVGAMDPDARKQSLTEIGILRKLTHPFIIGYRNAWISDGVLSICMDYAEQGDLYHVIRRQKGAYFDEAKVLQWFAQLTLALDYIHSRHILHRDIKTQNVFVTSSNLLKLGDFGISRVLSDTSEHALTVVGTPYYLSPELCKSLPYGYKSDVWALGCVIYELLSLRHAFTAESIGCLVLKICMGAYPPLPLHYSQNIVSLVSSMLSLDPEQRPSVEALLRNRTLREPLHVAIATLDQARKPTAPETKPSMPIPGTPDPRRAEEEHQTPIARGLNEKQVPCIDVPASVRKSLCEDAVSDEMQMAPEQDDPDQAGIVEIARAYTQEELQKMTEVANMMSAVSNAEASIHSRMEGLRMLLERRLGEDLFLSAHRAVDELQRSFDSDVDDEQCMQAIKESLGPQWMYFPLVIQLVNCENAIAL